MDQERHVVRQRRRSGYLSQVDADDSAEYGRSLRGVLGALLVTPEKTPRPQPARTEEFLSDDLDEAKQEAVPRALGASDLLAVEGLRQPSSGSLSSSRAMAAASLNHCAPTAGLVP
jgi:hypothetical protein